MVFNQDIISKESAAQQVNFMIPRLVWLHYAFTQTLMEELGSQKGKKLAKKGIGLYGELTVR